MRKLSGGYLFIALMLVCLSNLPLWARGGGGCLVEGTYINMPSGEMHIEEIKPGSYVLGWTGTQIIPSRVIKVSKVSADEYVEITTLKGIIKATPEHLFFINRSELKRAQDIFSSDQLLMVINKTTSLVPILSVKTIKAHCFAYNLMVDSPATFLMQNTVVHNKGCFLPDTEILLIDGRKILISQVKAGDNLLAFTPDEKIITAPVHEIITTKSDKYYEISTGRTIIKVTPEHPLYVGNKTFRLAEAVKVGDRIFIFEGKGLSEQVIRNKRLISSPCLVYNLRTDYPNTFFANNLAVHNKGGGCFQAGTMIVTPDGSKSIERIGAGEMVLGVSKNNSLIPIKVLKTFSTVSELIEIRSERGNIRTTFEHPLLKINGDFELAGTLKPGDLLVSFNSHNKSLNASKVLSLIPLPGKAEVYNIEVESPNTFIASNLVVHNKGGSHGGGFHGGRSGRGGSSDVPPWVIFYIVVIIIFAILQDKKDKKMRQGENLDYCYPVRRIQSKVEKTANLLNFLGKQDQSVSLDLLKKITTDTFLKLQECWQAREYSPMEPLMMTDIYRGHLEQISSLRRNHEINMIADLKVDFVEIVNIRYYEKKEKREFTALIQATARDYYTDDRSGEFIRGDEEPATFQEFWTFQYNGTNWLLRQIEQTKESDVLSERNFVEMFTDEQLCRIYGGWVSKDAGPIGPEADKDIITRDDRIHRHLNFLVQIDKIWNENEMKETARKIFVSVQLARESGNTDNIKMLLFPEVLRPMQAGIDIRKNRGETIEFRNLCVRRIDIVLIRNFSDNTKDEFTVRITAHAQKVGKRNDKILYADEYVSPFEEYWTFGRKDNQWLLKEILPSFQPLQGKANLDEDASKEEMEWYYTKDRAL